MKIAGIICVPVAFSTFLFDLGYIVIDKLMVTYGDIPLAAIGIVLKAERLPLNVGIGICLGMVPLVAYTYSSKDHQRMEEIIRYSRNVGLLVAAGSIVCMNWLRCILFEFLLGMHRPLLWGSIF